MAGYPPLRHRTESAGGSHSSHPLHRSSSVPFSWERLPGIPKSSAAPTPSPDHLLPLPPTLRFKSDAFLSASSTKKRANARRPADPFAAALTECAKDSPAPDEMDELRRRREAAARSRALATALTGRLWFLYSSCKAACSVSDSTVRIAVRRRGRAGEPSAWLNRS